MYYIWIYRCYFRYIMISNDSKHIMKIHNLKNSKFLSNNSLSLPYISDAYFSLIVRETLFQ